jgi:hypothetical protein
MAHAQKPDFVLMLLKCDGICAETRLRLTAFEVWWHMRRNQMSSYCVWNVMAHAQKPHFVLQRFKCIGTCAETKFRLTEIEMWWHTEETGFRLSAKRTNSFNSAGERQFSRLLAAEVCASAVVILDTPCFEVVRKVLATHSIRQFPLNFPSRASPCAITFQLQSKYSNY